MLSYISLGLVPNSRKNTHFYSVSLSLSASRRGDVPFFGSFSVTCSVLYGVDFLQDRSATASRSASGLARPSAGAGSEPPRRPARVRSRALPASLSSSRSSGPALRPHRRASRPIPWSLPRLPHRPHVCQRHALTYLPRTSAKTVATASAHAGPRPLRAARPK